MEKYTSNFLDRFVKTSEKISCSISESSSRMKAGIMATACIGTLAAFTPSHAQTKNITDLSKIDLETIQSDQAFKIQINGDRLSEVFFTSAELQEMSGFNVYDLYASDSSPDKLKAVVEKMTAETPYLEHLQSIALGFNEHTNKNLPVMLSDFHNLNSTECIINSSIGARSSEMVFSEVVSSVQSDLLSKDLPSEQKLKAFFALHELTHCTQKATDTIRPEWQESSNKDERAEFFGSFLKAEIHADHVASNSMKAIFGKDDQTSEFILAARSVNSTIVSIIQTQEKQYDLWNVVHDTSAFISEDAREMKISDPGKPIKTVAERYELGKKTNEKIAENLGEKYPDYKQLLRNKAFGEKVDDQKVYGPIMVAQKDLLAEPGSLTDQQKQLAQNFIKSMEKISPQIANSKFSRTSKEFHLSSKKSSEHERD